jgi:RNA polymerase sigma-70 factor (ECF subfamily)
MSVGVIAAVADLDPPIGAALNITDIYAEHAPFVGRIILRLVGRGAHVDDLLQETFIVAFKKRHEFDGRAKVTTWLYAIASHLCLRYRRSVLRFALFRARLPQPGDDVPPPFERPDGRLERRQDIALVEAGLQKLPFKQREVFVLYELEGMEGSAIAELLGIPVGTVWTRLHEGRKRFKELMRRRLAKEAAP